MVARAKDYIAAGDIFQVVLAQRFEAPFALPPFALYRALRRVNPAPFLFYLDYADFAVAGSSPEILVRTRGDTVTIRPIAGTRPRGATPHEDKALEDELLADPKERAEHLMLLDLGRNDVGRVAAIGSVEVTDQFFIERYSQVMHIVSNVEGRLDPRRDALDALAAGFPAGTVSGAPKVRAMEIIDELEKEKRGLYAGCVGYFSAAGDMDSCIVLRTALVKDGRMYVQAGAGIVADSDPASEQQECINKAKALFRAAEEARRFAERRSQGAVIIAASVAPAIILAVHLRRKRVLAVRSVRSGGSLRRCQDFKQQCLLVGSRRLDLNRHRHCRSPAVARQHDLFTGLCRAGRLLASPTEIFISVTFGSRWSINQWSKVKVEPYMGPGGPHTCAVARANSLNASRAPSMAAVSSASPSP